MFKKWLFVIFFPQFCWATISNLTVVGVTPVQAIISYKVPSSTSPVCFVEVSESSTFSPLVNDVIESYVTGSSSDTTRSDTFVSGLTRTVTIGHRNSAVNAGISYSLALANETLHYIRLTCGTDVSSMTFTTVSPGIGDIHPDEIPFNPNAWSNYPWPTLDPSSQTFVVDPMTGTKFQTFTRSGDFGLTSPQSVFTAYYSSGVWTSSANIISGNATSTATVSTTDPIFVWVDPTNNDNTLMKASWNGDRTVEDFGVNLWAGGTSATAADRQFSMCISVDGATCYSNVLTTTAPQGLAQSIGTMPTNFPTPFYNGWGGIGKAPPVDKWITSGTVNVTAGTMTITSATNFFPISPSLSTGSLVYVAGPGCPSNICTIKSIIDLNTVVLSSSFTATAQHYYTGSYAIKIWKNNATGSLALSTGYQAAGQEGYLEHTSIYICNQNTFLSGDGKKGRLCTVGGSNFGTVFMYWEGDDGTVRAIGAGATDRPGAADDLSNITQSAMNDFVGFDPVDPRTFYMIGNSNSGFLSIYKGVYTSTVPYRGFIYGGGPGGNIATSPSENITYTTITPHSTGKSIPDIFPAACPSYNASVFGAFSGSGYPGSGKYAKVASVYSGQDGGPAWVAVVDMTTGTIVECYHTLDGTGNPGEPNYRWGAMHSTGGFEFPISTMFESFNTLRGLSGGSLFSGPFISTTIAVRRGGNYTVAESSLPWPINGSYDNTCPVGNPYESLGATGNQCAFIKLVGNVCNASTGATEKSLYPCPWSTGYSQPTLPKPGDIFNDQLKALAEGDEDEEHFRIIQINPLAGGTTEYVVQRDAVQEYCSLQTGVDSPAQGQHDNGWLIQMLPGQRRTCSGALYLKNEDTGEQAEIGRTLGISHFALGNPSNSGDLLFTTQAGVTDNTTLTGLTAFPVIYQPFNLSGFNGFRSNAPIQGYSKRSQWNATGKQNEWIADHAAYLPSGGNNIIGSVTTSLAVGTTHVYQISIVGGVSYKNAPLMGWAGRYNYGEKSGPNSLLVDTDTYRFCYAYLNGECRPGSTAGQAFMNIYLPNLTGNCATSDSASNEPCIISAYPYGNYAIRRGLTGEINGETVQKISMEMSTGWGQYVFSKNIPDPSGFWDLFNASSWRMGVHNMGIMAKYPMFRKDSVTRSSFESIPVVLGTISGSDGARIRFGYGDYGTPSQFYCTERQESCVTDASVSPFAFLQSDALTSTPCSSGCTINIPAITNRILYYRVERTNGGNLVSAGPIQELAVP